MGFNQFAGEIGEQIAKQVTRMKPGLSSGAKGVSQRATSGMNRGRAAVARVAGGMSPQATNRAIGYGVMGSGAGGVVYGANKMRRKSKPPSQSNVVYH